VIYLEKKKGNQKNSRIAEWDVEKEVNGSRIRD
jgi:hypothetical protein